MTVSYISTGQFAAAAGLDRRSAARILKQAKGGRPWRGHALVVKAAHGRGGRQGAQYRVEIDSLPELLRCVFVPRLCTAEQSPKAIAAEAVPLDGAVLRAVARQRCGKVATAQARFDAVRFALEAPRGSGERSRRVLAVAGQTGTSPTTIYRWITRYEEGGMVALMPAFRPPKGSTLVVSRSFDKAMRARGLASDLRLIGREVEILIKATWASRFAMAGMNEMAVEIGTALRTYCEHSRINVLGLDCRPSLTLIRRYYDYSLVHLFANDAREMMNVLPRVQRSVAMLRPMEVVVVDTKFADINVELASGERVGPAVIAFLDAATGRVFHYLTPKKKQSVCKEAVKTALLRMMVDETGVCQRRSSSTGVLS